jgi:Flp pilus assembly pilin Flp
MKVMLRLNALWNDQQGGENVEWPLVAALLTLAAIAGWGILDGRLITAFTDIGQAVTDTTNGLQ